MLVRSWKAKVVDHQHLGWEAIRPENQVRTGLPAGGSGFEPSVPLPRLSSIRAVRAEIRRSKYGCLSARPRVRCLCPPGTTQHLLPKSVFDRPGSDCWNLASPLCLTRDRWFESGPLQQRVRSEPGRRSSVRRALGHPLVPVGPIRRIAQFVIKPPQGIAQTFGEVTHVPTATVRVFGRCLRKELVGRAAGGNGGANKLRSDGGRRGIERWRRRTRRRNTRWRD